MKKYGHIHTHTHTRHFYTIRLKQLKSGKTSIETKASMFPHFILKHVFTFWKHCKLFSLTSSEIYGIGTSIVDIL